MKHQTNRKASLFGCRPPPEIPVFSPVCFPLSIKNYKVHSLSTIPKHKENGCIHCCCTSKTASALGKISETQSTKKTKNSYCLGMLYINAKQTGDISFHLGNQSYTWDNMKNVCPQPFEAKGLHFHPPFPPKNYGHK